MEATPITKEQQDATKLVNVTGILSIIFGSLGTLFGSLMLFFGNPGDTGIDNTFFGLLILLLWVLPHVFLIISGIQLVQLPRKSLARGLIITTLVIGAFWNIILLAFAIINLAQIAHYQSASQDK